MLYPDTTYSCSSGGDPAAIPFLKHEDLVAFHARHYHPSNAYFFTYGNLPFRKHLRFIQHTVLKDFCRIDPGTDVEPQPRWTTPRAKEVHYPLEKSEDPSKRCQVALAWLAADIGESFEILVLTLLERILLGNAASPLRKALIESGLGAALSDGTGFDPDNRDTLFACGLKDVASTSADAIATLVLDTLRELVSGGIDPQLVEAAIHQIEFHKREITNAPYPYGLKLLLSLSGTWFHGGDPARALDFEADMVRLRRDMTGGGLFEDRIQRYFIDNPHRVLLTLVPDHTMAQREDDRVSEELRQIRSAMSDADVGRVKTDAAALSTYQSASEDVSLLPTLEIADIPGDVVSIPESDEFPDIPAACYSQPTAGILYFHGFAGVGMLPAELMPFVPFFAYALPKVGTALRSYDEMANRIDTFTGGIRLNANARTGYHEVTDCIPCVSIGGKCLVRNEDRMFDIIQELISRHDFSDLSRLKHLLMEYRAGLASMVIPDGHRMALSLASRNFSKTNTTNEMWHGIHQLKTIKDLTADLADDVLRSLSGRLTEIGGRILAAGNLRLALVGEDDSVRKAGGPVDALLGAAAHPGSDTGGSGFTSPMVDMADFRPREGWTTSSAVSYVALVFPTVRLAHEDAAVLSVISKMLRSLYVHREVREKGGAYGGYAMYGTESGLLSLASYRDPHIASTLSAFGNAALFVQSGDYTDEDVKEAILQVCSEIDRPDPPGPAAIKAFSRKIVALSDDMRLAFKTRLLAVTRSQVLDAGKRYFSDIEEKAAVAVISGTDQLEAANGRLSGNPLRLHEI